MMGLGVSIGVSEIKPTKSLGQARKDWNVCITIYTSYIGTKTKTSSMRISSTVTLISLFDSFMKNCGYLKHYSTGH